MSWVRILGAGALVYIIIAIEKYFRRKSKKNRDGAKGAL